MSIEGLIVSISGATPGRIEINPSTGLIESVGKTTGQADLLFNDELIFPGFIDLHVHAREDVSHSQDYKEDFASASKAAIAGGVAAFMDMPNNPVAPVDKSAYKAKQKLAEKSLVEAVLYAGIGPSTRPLPFKVPYKVFTGPSVGDLFFKFQNQLEEVLKNYHGQSVSFHCEDPEILEKFKDAPAHEDKRPKAAEIQAIDFALQLIEKYNLQGKICHVSTAEGVKKIIEAKKREINVTCEVTPHHLYFEKETLNESNHKLLQVNPPIRLREDRLALIDALKKGGIDYLATDHAPHTREEKQKGISGMPHLDTYGPFAAWLMDEHEFTSQDILRVCSDNPGKFFSQFSNIKYGKVEEGFAGSLTILHPRQPITINPPNLKTKCGWSPFEGVTFPGRAVTTIVKGKVYKI